MNRQEFEDTTRRYREEMFRMYASRQMNPPPKPDRRPQNPPQPDRPAPRPMPDPPRPQNPPQPGRPAPRPMPDALRPQNPPPALPLPLPNAVTALSETNTQQDFQPDPPYDLPESADAETQDNTAAVQDAYPDARPGDFPDDTPADDEPEFPKRPYTGTIRVHVVTAAGAKPVAGASVTVTRFTGSEPTLISLQTTDSSGLIKPVTVPAPPPSDDQRHPQSFVYDISVQAAGYYREHSADVPVFPNVTSVQTFALIPLPAGPEMPLPGGDFTYYNDMQQY